MKHQLLVARPSGRLRNRVTRYCAYDVQTAEPEQQREPLSTDVVLIVGVESELSLIDRSAPERPVKRLSSFVAGLDDACALVGHDGRMRGVQVDLSPLAAWMIFQVPLHSLARRIVALDDLLGTQGRQLEERLTDASDWQSRLDLVHRTFIGKLANAKQPPADIEWAWQRLTGTHGRLRIGDLARELGCSRKHLAVRFREHVGLPPKMIARMLRFKHACDLCCSTGDLAELAAMCGYYDQSHLDRDFRDFADATPRDYMERAVTFLQDTTVFDA